MKQGESIIIEKCASGFIVRPMTAQGGVVFDASSIVAFSEIGHTPYQTNLTLLAWVAKHFASKEEA